MNTDKLIEQIERLRPLEAGNDPVLCRQEWVVDKVLALVEEANDTIELRRVCPGCKEHTRITVDTHAYTEWKKGALIQDAFPLFTPSERELVMTGYCETCWDKIGEEQ